MGAQQKREGGEGGAQQMRKGGGGARHKRERGGGGHHQSGVPERYHQEWSGWEGLHQERGGAEQKPEGWADEQRTEGRSEGGQHRSPRHWGDGTGERLGESRRRADGSSTDGEEAPLWRW